jgi:hypothetical protein
MIDYFANLAVRALVPESTVQPRFAPLYAPRRGLAAEPLAGRLYEHEAPDAADATDEVAKDRVTTPSGGDVPSGQQFSSQPPSRPELIPDLSRRRAAGTVPLTPPLESETEVVGKIRDTAASLPAVASTPLRPEPRVLKRPLLAGSELSLRSVSAEPEQGESKRVADVQDEVAFDIAGAGEPPYHKSRVLERRSGARRAFPGLAGENGIADHQSFSGGEIIGTASREPAHVVRKNEIAAAGTPRGPGSQPTTLPATVSPQDVEPSMSYRRPEASGAEYSAVPAYGRAVPVPHWARAPIASATPPIRSEVQRSRQSEGLPDIHVTIGRVEVRALPPGHSEKPLVKRGRPAMNLQDYLRHRQGSRE